MSPALNFDPQSPEITAIDLARALDRLERKILSTPPEPRLLYDSYERTKTAAVSLNPLSRNLSPPYHLRQQLRCKHTEPRIRTHPPPSSRTHLLPTEDPVPPATSPDYPPRPARPSQTPHRPPPRTRPAGPRLAFRCLTRRRPAE